jgi:hypothetical protein
MTKVDLDRVDVEEPEQFSLQYSFAEEMSWGRVLTGALALIISVCGAAYWAGARSVRIEGGPKPASSPTVLALGDESFAAERREQSGANEPTAPTFVPFSSVTFAAMPRDIGASPMGRTSVSFLAPVEGATVQPGVVVRGLARGVREEKQLWLVTRGVNAEMAPRDRITLSAEGIFESRLDQLHDPGPLSICLVAVNSAVGAQFERGLSDAEASRSNGAFVEGGAVQVLGCQDVTLHPSPLVHQSSGP